MEETQAIIGGRTSNSANKIGVSSLVLLVVLVLLTVLLCVFNIIALAKISSIPTPPTPTTPPSYGTANNVFAKYVAKDKIEKGTLVTLCDPKSSTACSGMHFKEYQTDMSVVTVPSQATQTKTVMLVPDELDGGYGYLYLGVQADGHIHAVCYVTDGVIVYFKETLFENILPNINVKNLIGLKALKQPQNTGTYFVALAVQSQGDTPAVNVVILKAVINTATLESQLTVLSDTALYTVPVTNAITSLEATLTVFSTDKIALVYRNTEDPYGRCLATSFQFNRDTGGLVLLKEKLELTQKCSKGMHSCTRDSSVFGVFQNQHIYIYSLQEDGALQQVTFSNPFIYSNHPYENTETLWALDKQCNSGYAMIRSLDNGLTIAAKVYFDSKLSRFETSRIVNFPYLISPTDQASMLMDYRRDNFAYIFFREAHSKLNHVVKVVDDEEVVESSGSTFIFQIPFFGKAIRMRTGRRVNPVQSPTMGTNIVLNDQQSTSNTMIEGFYSGGLRPLGVAVNSASPNEEVTVQLKGVSNVFTKLKPGVKYYGDFGSISSAQEDILLGVALSSSEILLSDKLFTEE